MRKMYVMIGGICLSTMAISCSNDNSLEQRVKDEPNFPRQERFEWKDQSNSIDDKYRLQEGQDKNEVQESDSTMPILEHNVPGRGSQDKDRDKKNGKPRQPPGGFQSSGNGGTGNNKEVHEN